MKRRRVIYLLVVGLAILCLLFAVSAVLGSIRRANTGLLNYNMSIQGIIGSQKIDKNDVSILIEKSKFLLTLFYKGKPIKSYPIVLGRDPIDDKLQEGDNCTPEGEFKVRDLYPSTRWSKFIWINYPSAESWKKFREAQRERKVKSAAGIGGDIGIHGSWLSNLLVNLHINWTRGCIAMKNKDMDELYAITGKGTNVKIVH